MSEKGQEKPNFTAGVGKLFAAITPSPDDLRRAAEIPAEQCPRRYCWWWRSLAFEWELAPHEGCTFLHSQKPPGYKQGDVPCRRCDSSSPVDHYEPREPHLLQDGFPVPRWHSNHRSLTGEISYDLVMDDDMRFVEGSYRIGECDWRVFIFSKLSIAEVRWKASTWDSGVSGIVFYVPLNMGLNMASVENLLSQVLGVGTWIRVRGPDSMQLR